MSASEPEAAAPAAVTPATLQDAMQACKPFLMTGACAAWAQPFVAGLQALATSSPSPSVRVLCIDKGKGKDKAFNGAVGGSQSVHMQLSTFAAHAAAVSSGSPDPLVELGQRFYLSQCTIAIARGSGGGGKGHVELPQLGALATFPLATAATATVATATATAATTTSGDVGFHTASLWWSPHMTRSSTHCDEEDNALCVAHGCKRVAVLSPAHSKLLTLRLPGDPAGPHHSDTEMWDAPARAARASAAKLSYSVREACTVYTIAAGDALYLPAGWWHSVVSDPGTVAVNYWFTAADHLPPPSSAAAAAAAPAGVPVHMRSYAIRRMLHAEVCKRMADKVAEWREKAVRAIADAGQDASLAAKVQRAQGILNGSITAGPPVKRRRLLQMRGIAVGPDPVMVSDIVASLDGAQVVPFFQALLASRDPLGPAVLLRRLFRAHATADEPPHLGEYTLCCLADAMDAAQQAEDEGDAAPAASTSGGSSGSSSGGAGAATNVTATTALATDTSVESVFQAVWAACASAADEPMYYEIEDDGSGDLDTSAVARILAAQRSLAEAELSSVQSEWGIRIAEARSY